MVVGSPGTGKSRMANALGVQAVVHPRKNVWSFATVDLVNAREQQNAMNKAGQLAERPLWFDFITLDEPGQLPLSLSAVALLFRRLGKLYERASVTVTTSLSELARMYGDAGTMTALLDRFTHHCHILETGNDSVLFRASAAALKNTKG